MIALGSTAVVKLVNGYHSGHALDGEGHAEVLRVASRPHATAGEVHDVVGKRALRGGRRTSTGVGVVRVALNLDGLGEEVLGLVSGPLVCHMLFGRAVGDGEKFLAHSGHGGSTSGKVRFEVPDERRRSP